MQFAQVRDVVVRAVITGAIAGLMMVGAIGLFAHQVFNEHAEMEKQLLSVHDLVLANTTSRNETLRTLAERIGSSKDQILANQERILTRFDRTIAQMLLLEARQEHIAGLMEKQMALFIDMRAVCQR